MDAASLQSTSISDDAAAARKKRKRGEKLAREEGANKRKRRKTLSSGDLADSGDEGGSDYEEEEDTPELRWRQSAASRLVLSALRRCFQSDRSGFVNKARFDLLLPAVVAQVECGSDFAAAASATTVGGSSSDGAASGQDEVSSCRNHAEELVGPCLAQLALASGKDALWKALANAVLMKTRSRRAGVRVAALVSLRQCFEVVGEEFLNLLPECLPFLSELLEVRRYLPILSVNLPVSQKLLRLLFAVSIARLKSLLTAEIVSRFSPLSNRMATTRLRANAALWSST